MKFIDGLIHGAIGVEGVVELLREDGEPALVVGREAALDAGARDEHRARADRAHTHRLSVDWEEGFEFHAPWEEREVGEVISTRVGARAGANRSERDGRGERAGVRQRARAYAGLHDARAIGGEDGHAVAVCSRIGGVPGPSELAAQTRGRVVGEIRRRQLRADQVNPRRWLCLERDPCQTGEHQARAHGETDDVGAALRGRGVRHRSDAAERAVEQQKRRARAAERRGRRSRDVFVSLQYVLFVLVRRSRGDGVARAV